MTISNTHQKQSGSSFFAMACMVLFITLISCLTYSKTPGSHAITKDAKEFTTASYHLFDKGMISHDGVNQSNFREPLPIAVLALHMALFTDIPKNLVDINVITTQPHYIKQINLVNLYYIVPALFVMWWVCFAITRSHWLSALLIFFSWSAFYVRPWYLGRPLSEYAASLLLLTIALFTLKLFKTPQHLMPRYLFITGIVIGLLALTKAAAFFVGLCFIPIALIFLGYVDKMPFKKVIGYCLIAYAGLLLTVGPWMVRNSMIKPNADNHTATSSAMIAGRGGAILMGRALLNQQIAPDPLGAMYAFSPPLLQINMFQKLLGFNDKDLWEGGKYASLNRNLIFIKSKNLDAIDEIQTQKDSQHMQLAAKSISANIQSHLITTGVLAWRGLWSYDGGNHMRPGGKSWFSIVFNFLSFALMLAMPVIALLTKNKACFAVFLFPCGMFWVYSLGTHFIPHYSAQLIPMTILASIVGLDWLLNILKTALKK